MKRSYKQKMGDAKKRFKTEAVIRVYLIAKETECFIQPIETVTANGVPDLFVHTVHGAAFWVELKTIKRVVKNIVSPNWRPGQLSWAKRYQKKEGHWLLLIQVNGSLYYTSIAKEKYDLSELHLYKGFVPEVINYLYSF